jgi:hypothetical protein
MNTNAVGSSGGSGGLMPKLKAVPAGSNKTKNQSGHPKGVFEISSKDRNDQYVKVGIQAKLDIRATGIDNNNN